MSKKLQKKRYYIKTFGCQMNYSDSERLASVCELMEYAPTSDLKEADLLIINSCSVRQRAEDRVIGMGKKVRELKKDNPKLTVILTGCMAKRSWEDNLNTKLKVEKSLKRKMPWLDFVMEINDLNKLPKMLDEDFEGKLEEEYLSFKPKYNSKFQAYVPISTGCDMHCTFCIVPYSRGKERDRRAEDIYKEVLGLVRDGYKDIMLLGQTVNSWHNGIKQYQADEQALYEGVVRIKGTKGALKKEKDTLPLTRDLDFADLLLMLDKIEGDWWLNFISSHPNFFTDKLITTLPKLTHLRPTLHFAVQSGSNKILETMNRKYSIEEYKDIVNKLRKEMPDISITTDIIVGFPGESDTDFAKTAELMEEVEYDMAYLNEYSPRSGTPSAEYMEDNVDVKVKSERKELLNEILKKSAQKKNKKLVGKNVKCLPYGHKDGFLLAKTDSMKDVRIKLPKDIESPQDLIGSFVNVKVQNAGSWSLEGTLIN